MRKTCSEWGGTWGKHMKAELFKELHECQKINHLPGKLILLIIVYLLLGKVEESYYCLVKKEKAIFCVNVISNSC